MPRPGFIAESCGVDVLVERHPVGIVLAKVLDEKNIEYRIADNNTADIYAELVFSEFAKDCEAAGCTIISMDEHDESLEAFYLSLLGGEDNV